jgi:CRP-like cAMP-binding protein
MSTSQQKPGSAAQGAAGKPMNRLLSALSAADYKRLVPHLELVHLEMKHVAYEPEQPIEYAYFPLTGLASMVTVMQGGKAIEVATIGNEGMVGLPLFLGVDRTAGQAYTQVPGDSLRIKADVFQKEVSRQAGLARMLQLYTQALLVQISQAMACNGIHPIYQRTARWLLMIHDRVASQRFPLSQEFLSQMLGVRRAGVSEVATKLRKAGLIRYSRGMIEIVDRAGLEAAACECYGVIQAEFVRLLGAPQKQGSP